LLPAILLCPGTHCVLPGISGFACIPRPVDTWADAALVLLSQPGYQIECGCTY
jgi:hypothetical protein